MKQMGIKKQLGTTFDAALEAIPAALKAEGFGILTEVDVQNTLRQKIGAETRRCRILGACNPQIAHRALTISPDAAVMMPCSVVVYEDDDGRATVVAVDPTQNVAVSEHPDVSAIAGEVRARLSKVLESL